MPGALDTTDLAYRWAGRTDPSTPTVVLFHGLGDSGDCWPDAVRRWSPTHVVVGVDALGHGGSPRFTPAQLASADPVEEMYAAAEAAVARIVAERADPVLLVGHSMGGGLAGALASRRPDLVRAVVLEEPAWRDPAVRVQSRRIVEERIAECRAFAEDVERELDKARAENPTWPEAEFGPWAESKTQVDLDFLELGVASLAEPWDEIVGRITAPALAVTGDQAVLIAPEVRQRAEALGNPNLRIEVVPGAGHCVRRDRPEEYHALVDPFLAEHAARP